MPLVLPSRYLEVQSVPLAGEGFCRIADLTPLFEEPDQIGDNRLVWGIDGRDPYAPRIEEGDKRLRIEILGGVDVNGTAHSDGTDGVEKNIVYLNSTVVAPTGTGDGTRPAVLHLPWGNRSANVQVRGLQLAERKAPDWARGLLILRIPAGRFS